MKLADKIKGFGKVANYNIGINGIDFARFRAEFNRVEPLKKDLECRKPLKRSLK